MIIVNADGGARGNPGPGAIGIVVRESGNIIEKYSEKIGKTTNNIAEYTALIKGLSLAAKHTKNEIKICMDSKLVIEQLKGNFVVRTSHLIPLFEDAKKKEKMFTKVAYEHVSREDIFQSMADELVNKALDDI